MRRLAGLGGFRPSILVGADGGQSAVGDAQREWPLVFIAPRHRERALCRNFLDQALGQQPAEDLAGRAALQVGAKFNAAVLALRGGGKQHQLGIGEFHRDSPFGWQRRVAPSPPKPRNGHEAGGAESRRANPLNQARTVTLCSQQKSSPFWIILLLDCGSAEHQMAEPVSRMLDAHVSELAPRSRRADQRDARLT
jgi:hypothetical protein